MRPQLSSRGLILPLLALVAFGLTAAFSSAPGTKRPSESLAEMVPGSRTHPTADSRTRSSRAARCGRSRCRPTGGASSPSTRPTTGSRSSASRARGLVHTASVPVGLEPVAVAARTDREVWVVNHLSDSVSIVELDGHDGDDTARPRRAHAARRRRAARHRLRRTGPQARVHHHRAPRPEHCRSIPSSRPRASAAPTSGSSTRDDLGSAARRHAAHDRHPLHRHAARARGDARRQPRLRRRLPHRQPDHHRRRDRRARRLRSGRRRRGRPPTPRARRAPEVGADRQVQRRALARRARPPARPVRALLAARQGRLRDRRHGQPAAPASRAPAASSRASARSSSTWPSTR